MAKTPKLFAVTLGAGLLASAAALAADRDPVPVTSQIEVAAVPTAAPVEVAAAAANCLLPGQLRNFGGVTLLTPKRAVTLQPADCVARGGAPTLASAN